MSNIEYEIKRLEDFYNGYKSIKDPSWVIKWGLPYMEKKLAELYAVRHMQTQHTNKPNEDEYYSNDESTKYITKKPFMVAAAEYAVKALPQNP